MRRKDRALTEERAYEILDNCDYGTLALSAAGKPYAVPINFVREGKNLYFHSAKAGKKVEMIGENRNVSISFVDYSELNPQKLTTNYRSVSVEGVASAVVDKDEKVHALKAICHRFAPISETIINTAIAKNLSATAVYKIEIIAITAKASEKK